jgi:hypothetical protein
MRHQQSTRRDVLKAAALVMAGSSRSGCGGGQRDTATEPRDAQPASTNQAIKARDMGPAFDRTFVWQVAATGAKGPGARSRHGLVYDQGAKTTVLFGGIIWKNNGILPADTWEFRDGQWSNIHTMTSPPGRHRAAMVHDVRRGQSVHFGGQGRQGDNWPMFGDTWTYADRRWRQSQPGASSRPRPRCGHALSFDEESGMTVLFGGVASDGRPLGDTWLFDGSSWRPVSGPGPVARRYPAFAFDPYLQGCVLNGGSEDDAGKHSFGDTWLFRDRTWTRLGNNFDTAPHDDHALAYHRTAKRLVMFGGLGGTHGVRVREANDWRVVASVPLPPRHQCSPLAWNDGLDGLVLHGGEAHHQGPQLDTTWVLRVAPGGT